ncbi:MAG: DNA-binding response regulator [Firmicutes bacterium HGW-Firmicutes-7]|nr:MAG: DNA-binding response regulator [Firmicutes bacterium HGW-Firmicutes-7]
MKILIADDEKDIRNLIKVYLLNNDYEIIEAENGIEVLEQIDDSIDLVILDVMMPKMDGIKTCIKIRERYTMPVLFLTAKLEDIDKLTGFNSGADDYITKPFNPLDLLARIKVNIRRYKEYSAPIIPKDNPEIITIHDLNMNLAAHTLHNKQELIKLTKIEFAILALFIKNRGRVFSLEQIYELVWEESSILNSESTVSVHIRNLREKIEADMSNPIYIKTVWGVGYRVD